MSEVCVREPIKIHIHPVLKLLIRREEGNYIAIITHKKRCLNVGKVRENMPPFAGYADDAACTESEFVELVQHCLKGGATYEKS